MSTTSSTYAGRPPRPGDALPGTRELLEVQGLTVRFKEPGWLARRTGRGPAPIVAVDDVTVTVPQGGSVGIVGESGSGKSTLARAVMGLNQPAAGVIRFRGVELGLRRDRATRRAIQMVFQDPGTTLNPSRTVESTLAEVLRVHRLVPDKLVDVAIDQLLDQVHLTAAVRTAKPRRLSGGQKQRVAIARALAVEPELLIADEATSALDVVVQAAILDLLAELRSSARVTLICISHDLDLVRYLCETTVVMNAGRIVESGPVETVFASPTQTYTAELVAAAPTLPGPGERNR